MPLEASQVLIIGVRLSSTRLMPTIQTLQVVIQI